MATVEGESLEQEGLDPDEVTTKKPKSTAIRFRVYRGLAFGAIALFSIPLFATTPKWRWALVVFWIGLSIAATTFLPLPKRVPKKRIPKVQGASGVIEDLTSKALERADRAMVGWLTIVGAVHSAAFAITIRNKGFNFFDRTESGLAAVAFLILGATCYAAHHAITRTRLQASRARLVASRLEPVGAYFRFVYEDEDETPVLAGLLLPILQGIGYAWLVIGAALVTAGYIDQILHPV